MTHFSILIKYEGKISDYEKKVGELLAPYKLAKWNWYQIGGRWEGMIALKEGKVGIAGRHTIGTPIGTPLGIDVAYLKDVRVECCFRGFFITNVVLDADGWHEHSYSYKNFIKRFLSKPTEKTVIVVVDAHKREAGGKYDK